jgi:hypothetical protein
MQPVLDQAQRLSDAALQNPSGASVQNSFHVQISMGASKEDSSGLEQALVGLLRTAARRSGLEV